MSRITVLPAAAVMAACSIAAQAQDVTTLSGNGVRLTTGAGYTFLNSDEIVYDGSGHRISHLFWSSQSPTVSAALEIDLGARWMITANGAFAGSGSSHMEDYDWLHPYLVSYDFNDWTHRSVHPDTHLHHYFSGDLAISRNSSIGAATLNIEGGVSYTDLAWTAYGGSFTYSDFGFRDNSGEFKPGEPGISFQQRYPGVFVGAGIAASAGRLTFKGQFRGGVSVGATDTDHHWARDLRFEERYGAIPFVSAGARVNYTFSDRSSIFLAGDLKQFFRAVGSSTLYNIPTGAQLGPASPGAAGMTLRAITVSTGLKIRF